MLLNEVMDLFEKSRTAPLTPQAWGSVKGKADKEQAQKIYDKARKIAADNLKEFTKLLNRVGSKIKDEKIFTDIKAADSFIEKVLNRGKDPSQITDVLRAAILGKTEEDVNKLVKSIKKEFVVVEYDHKTAEKSQGGYFGAHHFLVKLGEGDNSIIAEIQVMTHKLWAYKKEAHKIYNKYKGLENMKSKEKDMDTKLSKMLFQKGNTQVKKPSKKNSTK